MRSGRVGARVLRFVDRCTEALQKVIEAKWKDRELPEAPEPEQPAGKVLDLMAGCRGPWKRRGPHATRTPAPTRRSSQILEMPVEEAGQDSGEAHCPIRSPGQTSADRSLMCGSGEDGVQAARLGAMPVTGAAGAIRRAGWSRRPAVGCAGARGWRA